MGTRLPSSATAMHTSWTGMATVAWVMMVHRRHKMRLLIFAAKNSAADKTGG